MRYCLLLLLCSTFCHAAADVEIKDLKPKIAVDGNSADLEFLAANHGPQDAGALTVRVYLFLGKKLVSTEEFKIQPVAHDADRTESIKVNVVEPVDSVRAELFDTQQADTVPSNNFQQAPLLTSGPRVTDLELSAGTIVSEQPVKDRNLIVRVHLINHGPEQAVRTHATAELMLYQKTVASVEKTPPKLAAGEERDFQFQILIPSDVPTTDGMVVVRWSPADETVQDNVPSNNTYSIPVNLVSRQPDLVVTDWKVDSNGVLKFGVKNRGNSPAAATTTILYVNGAQTKRFSTPVLAPGAEQRHFYGGTKIPPGSQITVVVDYNADVAEASEENNRLQFVTK